MKKSFAIISIAAMVLSLSSCEKDNSQFYKMFFKHKDLGEGYAQKLQVNFDWLTMFGVESKATSMVPADNEEAHRMSADTASVYIMTYKNGEEVLPNLHRHPTNSYNPDGSPNDNGAWEFCKCEGIQAENHYRGDYDLFCYSYQGGEGGFQPVNTRDDYSSLGNIRPFKKEYMPGGMKNVPFFDESADQLGRYTRVWMAREKFNAFGKEPDTYKEVDAHFKFLGSYYIYFSFLDLKTECDVPGTSVNPQYYLFVKGFSFGLDKKTMTPEQTVCSGIYSFRPTTCMVGNCFGVLDGAQVYLCAVMERTGEGYVYIYKELDCISNINEVVSSGLNEGAIFVNFDAITFEFKSDMVASSASDMHWYDQGKVSCK